jgi:hypothetical protein
MLLLMQNITFCLERELVSVPVSVLSANSSDNYGLCFHNTIRIKSRSVFFLKNDDGSLCSVKALSMEIVCVNFTLLCLSR